MSDIVTAILELQTRRKWAIKMNVRQENAVVSLLARYCGYVPKKREEGSEEDKELKACFDRARAILGSKPKPGDEDIAAAFAEEIACYQTAQGIWQKRRDQTEKKMEELARQLAAYAFVKSVAGFGDKAFAILVGEAGDLSRYANPAKLWKRLGLAPYNGRAMSNWHGEQLTKEEWIACGYSKRRRAEIHACLADPLSKHQLVSAAKSGTKYGLPKGPYGDVYVRRREHTEITHPDWTKGHSRDDALRIMTKELILHLWMEWRRAAKELEPREPMRAAEFSDDAARVAAE